MQIPLKIYDRDGSVLDTTVGHITQEEAEEIIDLAVELALLRRSGGQEEDFVDRLADAVERAGLI